MANRDFKKIERTIKDFSLNVGSGSGSGDIEIVDTLPATAKEGDFVVLKSEISPSGKNVDNVPLTLYEMIEPAETPSGDQEMTEMIAIVYPDEYDNYDFLEAMALSLGKTTDEISIHFELGFDLLSQSAFEQRIEQEEMVLFNNEDELLNKPVRSYYRKLNTVTVHDMSIIESILAGEIEGDYMTYYRAQYAPLKVTLLDIQISSSQQKALYRNCNIENDTIISYTDWEESEFDKIIFNLETRTNQIYDSVNPEDQILINEAMHTSPNNVAIALLNIEPLEKEYDYTLYQYEDGEWVEQGDSGEGNPDGVKVIKFEETSGGEYYINSTKLKEYIVAKYGEEELSESLYSWSGSGNASHCILFSGETNGNPEEYLIANIDATRFELFNFTGVNTSSFNVNFFNQTKQGSVSGSSIYNVGNFIDLFSSIHNIGLYEGEQEYYVYNNLTLFIQYYIRRDNSYVTHNIVVDLTEEEVREIFNTRK